jgi:hypothetical protein
MGHRPILLEVDQNTGEQRLHEPGRDLPGRHPHYRNGFRHHSIAVAKHLGIALYSGLDRRGRRHSQEYLRFANMLASNIFFMVEYMLAISLNRR